jgi:hypothetical protein
MPRVNIYIRNEDHSLWQAIADKPGCVGKLGIMLGNFNPDNLEGYDESADTEIN